MDTERLRGLRIKFKFIDIQGVPKSAILIPVYVEGQGRFLFQLDTGCDKTIFYSEFLKEKIKNFNKRRYFSISLGNNLEEQYKLSLPLLKIPSFSLKNHNLWRKWKNDKNNMISGVLGMDFLERFNWMIDFSTNFLFLYPKNSEFSDVTDKTNQIKFSFKYNRRERKIFSELKVLGLDKSLKAFYDTGASPIGVALSYKMWQSLTGKTLSSQGVEIFVGPSWNKLAQVFQAESLYDIEVFNIKFEKPIVSTIVLFDTNNANDENHLENLIHAQALIGNSLFFGCNSHQRKYKLYFNMRAKTGFVACPK